MGIFLYRFTDPKITKPKYLYRIILQDSVCTLWQRSTDVKDRMNSILLDLENKSLVSSAEVFSSVGIFYSVCSKCSELQALVKNVFWLISVLWVSVKNTICLDVRSCFFVLCGLVVHSLSEQGWFCLSELCLMFIGDFTPGPWKLPNKRGLISSTTSSEFLFDS